VINIEDIVPFSEYEYAAPQCSIGQQIQDRVLGPGVNSSSLFTAVPGYATGGIRFGVKAGRHQLTVHAENLTDRNYRGISWGVDAPGRGISARYSVGF